MLSGIPIGLLHKIANVCNQAQVTVLEVWQTSGKFIPMFNFFAYDLQCRIRRYLLTCEKIAKVVSIRETQVFH